MGKHPEDHEHRPTSLRAPSSPCPISFLSVFRILGKDERNGSLRRPVIFQACCDQLIFSFTQLKVALKTKGFLRLFLSSPTQCLGLRPVGTGGRASSKVVSSL